MCQWIKKYGVPNISMVENWNEIMKASCNEKYGVDNVFQLNNIKEKSKQTSIDKYGVPYHCQNNEQKQKHYIGENSPSWINGRSYEEQRYTKENAQWRFTIYKRDKFVCRCCGDDNGGNLNAHHLNSWKY